jgi:hypothetical protein
LKCRCPKWPHTSHLDICNTSYGRKKGQESNWQFDSRPLKVGNQPVPSVCRWVATHRWKSLEESYNFASDLIIVVTYSQFDSNIRIFYVFLGFFRNTLKYFIQRPIFKPLYFYNDFLKILENTSFWAPLRNTRISYVTSMDLIQIRGRSRELWAPKVLGVQTEIVSKLLLRSHGTKSHSDVASVGERKEYYMGESGGFPRVRAVVSQVRPCCPWLAQRQKWSKMKTNQLTVGFDARPSS